MFKFRLIHLTKGSQQGHNTMRQKKVDITVDYLFCCICLG